MSLKINNDTITISDLTGGNSNTTYFGGLTQLVPNKTGYKLFGSNSQRSQLKQFVNDNFTHNINYTPKITNIVNPGDNTSFYTKTSETHTIYSSFSTTKFIKLAHPFMPENNTWSITMRIKTPSSFDAANQFFGSHSSYYKTVGGEFGTNQHFGCGITSNGSSWDIGWIWGTTTLNANTWYYYKLSFTGTQYVLESKKDGDSNYILQGVIDSTTPIYQGADSIICLGHQGNGYLRGELDLTATKIIIDNVVWFDGSINSYDCEINGTSLYKKVNNGQITYSNFSTSNYLKTINNFAPENNNWSIEVPIITGSNISTGQNVISEHTNYSFGIGEVSGHFNYYLSSNGTSWTTSDDPGSFTINSNTAYTWKSEYNAQNNLFTCYVKEGNNSYVEDYSNSSGIHAPTNYLKFGVSRTSVAPWLGQIVLSGVKIKIGNDIWFNGETANVKEFSLQGSPTISQEEVYYYTYYPFTFSFNINDATFTQGTKYLLEHPNLIKVKTENNNIYFNFPWKSNKWYYLPNNILTTGENSVTLTADDSQGGETEADQIKLIINNHNFTLVASGEDMPIITTGVLGYRENLVF